jgi:hypothetical protein
MAVQIVINEKVKVVRQAPDGSYQTCFFGSPEKLSDYLDDRGVSSEPNIYLRVRECWGPTAVATINTVRETVNPDEADAIKWRRLVEKIEAGQVDVIFNSQADTESTVTDATTLVNCLFA